MLSRILDLIVPARRERRRQIKAVEGLIENYLDPKLIEEELKKQDVKANAKESFPSRADGPVT